MIFQGDNTGAFGNSFITINLDNPQGFVISKAIFVCGCIEIPYENPVFPWVINLTSQQTAGLGSSNVCYLVVYDEQGRQATCQGTLKFNAQNGVLQNGRTCC